MTEPDEDRCCRHCGADDTRDSVVITWPSAALGIAFLVFLSFVCSHGWGRRFW